MMCQDNPSDLKPASSEERKSKKRKVEPGLWPSGQKKGKPGMNDMMDSDSESDNSDGYGNEDDTMNSNSTNDDIEGPSSVSQNEFASDLELYGMDTPDALGGQENRTSSDMDNSNDGDVEDIIRYCTYNLIHMIV